MFFGRINFFKDLNGKLVIPHVIMMLGKGEHMEREKQRCLVKDVEMFQHVKDNLMKILCIWNNGDFCNLLLMKLTSSIVDTFVGC